MKNLDCFDNLLGLQLSFNIPSVAIKSVGESLHLHFPEIFNSSIKDIFISSKRNGALKGNLTLKHDHRFGQTLHLNFNDGLYEFKKKEYDLKQFEIQIAGDELGFSAFSHQERCPFQMISKISWPACRKGQSTFITPETLQPLLIKWENHPQKGLIVRSMKGDFSGCFIDLTEDLETLQNTDLKALKGKVIFNFNTLCPLLSTQAANRIKNLQLGSSYTFNGKFWMNPDLGKTFSEMVYFKGQVKSEEVILKGYQLQNLQADVQYVPGRFDIQNFSIQDPAGSLKAPSLIATLDPKQEAWSLFIPSLSVKNLRVSLLRDAEAPNVQTKAKFRSLIIKKIEFQNFYGNPDNQKTWQAKGHLHFTNPARKNLFHPLFAIPGEIILRLGLDTSVLNPVTGTIHFNLQGDRFYMTKFKDMYSEGRGSKFNLVQGPNPSWMDFNGNLSFQIRMKQYNLLFKIAELFTVSVSGNIRKPTYALQKQPKGSHKGQASIF